MSLKPFRQDAQGRPFPFRRSITWIVPDGKRVKAIQVGTDGLYDDDRVVVLPRSDPWSRIARKLFALGGQVVELANGDDDRYLADLLLSHAVVTYPVLSPPLLRKQSYEWYCLDNARNAIQATPGARLAVGLAHHEGWAWVLHTWGLTPLSRVVEGTDLARWYYGLRVETHGAKLLKRWHVALRAT